MPKTAIFKGFSTLSGFWRKSSHGLGIFDSFKWKLRLSLKSPRKPHVREKSGRHFLIFFCKGGSNIYRKMTGAWRRWGQDLFCQKKWLGKDLFREKKWLGKDLFRKKKRLGKDFFLEKIWLGSDFFFEKKRLGRDFFFEKKWLGGDFFSQKWKVGLKFFLFLKWWGQDIFSLKFSRAKTFSSKSVRKSETKY